MFERYIYILLVWNHHLNINSFSICMGQWRRNVHRGEVHYQLIICDSSLWYCSAIAFEKIFQVLSLPTEFITRPRELKEWQEKNKLGQSLSLIHTPLEKMMLQQVSVKNVMNVEQLFQTKEYNLSSFSTKCSYRPHSHNYFTKMAVIR